MTADERRVEAGLGFALACSALTLSLEGPQVVSGGGRMDLARKVALTVVGHAADLAPGMTVRELCARLERGGLE